MLDVAMRVKYANTIEYDYVTDGPTLPHSYDDSIPETIEVQSTMVKHPHAVSRGLYYSVDVSVNHYYWIV